MADDPVRPKVTIIAPIPEGDESGRSHQGAATTTTPSPAGAGAKKWGASISKVVKSVREGKHHTNKLRITTDVFAANFSTAFIDTESLACVCVHGTHCTHEPSRCMCTDKALVFARLVACAGGKNDTDCSHRRARLARASELRTVTHGVGWAGRQGWRCAGRFRCCRRRCTQKQRAVALR